MDRKILESGLSQKESIDIDYKKIRKKEEYEPIILKIMNDSRICFSSSYEHKMKQDHGEPDFVDVVSGEIYDAKLLFESELCRALNENRVDDFMISLMNFVGVDFPAQREKGPKELELCKEMKSRIDSLRDDETGILFCHFRY